MASSQSGDSEANSTELSSSRTVNCDQCDNEMKVPFAVNCDQCGNKLDVFDRSNDERYKDWILATLCIQYTKEGIEPLAEDLVKRIHTSIKTFLEDAEKCSCKLKSLHNDGFKCKSGKCTDMKKELLIYFQGRSKPNWSVESSKRQICDSDEHFFKLLMPSRCSNCKGPKDVDCSALFELFEMTKMSPIHLDYRSDSLHEVRNARNELMHSGTMRLQRSELEDYGNRCLNFLKGTINTNSTNGDFCERAEKKSEEIDKILYKKLTISFGDAEKIAMNNHYEHIEGEVETLKEEIESDECTPQQLIEKKERLKKLNDRLIERGAVMKFMNISPEKTEDLKRFTDDVYKIAENKQLDVSTKLDKFQTDVKTFISNEIQTLNTKLETEVGNLQTALDAVQTKVNSLEQHNQQEDTRRETAEKNRDTGITSLYTRQNHDEEIHRDYIHGEGTGRFTSQSPKRKDGLDRRDDTTEAMDPKPYSQTDRDYVGGSTLATGTMYSTVCKSIHADIQQLNGANGETTTTMPTKNKFPLLCEEENCFCLQYGDFLWNLSKFAYCSFLSGDDEETNFSDDSPTNVVFGMSKQDLEMGQKSGILRITQLLEEILAKKLIDCVYFTDRQQQYLLAVVYLSTDQLNETQDILPKLYPDVEKIQTNADFLTISASYNAGLARIVSEYMMKVLSTSDVIQDYRTTSVSDGRDTIEKIQDILLTADRAMSHGQTNNTGICIEDIVVKPGNFSNVVCSLERMNVTSIKSIDLVDLQSNQTTQIVQCLSESNSISKMKLARCEVERGAVKHVVRNSLCVLDARSLRMSHNVFDQLLRNVSVLESIKFVGFRDLVCDTHGQNKDKCGGLSVDFTGSHTQLESVWIIKCPIDIIRFNDSTKQLKKVYLSEVEIKDSCLKSIWESLPANNVNVWLWDVTIELDRKPENIINELTQSREAEIKHDDGHRDEDDDGKLFVIRLELEKIFQS